MFPKGILYNKEKKRFPNPPEISEVAFAMEEIARGIEGNEKGDLGNLT